MEKLLYHTTAKRNINSILQEGFKPSPISEKYWLGRGVYFFEDVYYAVDWGIIGVLKKNKIKWNIWSNKCGIISAKIDYDKFEIIEVSTPLGYSLFKAFMEKIKKNYSEEEYNDIENKGLPYMIKVMEVLEQNSNEKYISNFDIVIGMYEANVDKKTIKYKSDFLTCTQKQICVKNLDCISKIKEIKCNDQQIVQTFALVIRNRGNKK